MTFSRIQWPIETINSPYLRKRKRYKYEHKKSASLREIPQIRVKKKKKRRYATAECPTIGTY